MLSGCSLILDFDGSTDPPIDAPFNDAECAFKEPNDTRETAATLELTDVGPAAICSQTPGVDDIDYYRVTIPTNTTAQFKITYFFSTNSDLDIRLTDAAGNFIARSASFDNDEVILCPGSTPPCAGPLAAGEYIFEVFPGEPGKATRYDIMLSVVP